MFLQTDNMKSFFKKIIVVILLCEAKTLLFFRKPKIIAVVGSVGKTSTKDAIYSALRDSVSVRKNKKSMNSEFGVPLTILNLESAWSSPLGWIINVLRGVLAIVSFKKYPNYLVLEVGTDMPGDMKKTAAWLKPDIVVITSLPELPVHVAHFKDPEALRKEDASIVHYMKKDAVLVLNADDAYAYALKAVAKKKTITFGVTSEVADVRISNYHPVYTETAPQLPTGISFKIAHQGATLPLNLEGILGVQHVYACAAAYAVASVFEIPELEILQGLRAHTTAPGRMKLLDGMNGSCIVDDSYNASPLAVEKAVLMVSELASDKKKIAVLGDMLELGTYSKKAHTEIGALLADATFTHVFTYGDEAAHITKEIHRQRATAITTQHVDSHPEIIEALQSLITAGDIVLIKGSQGSRMEKVITPLLRNAQDSNKLVRQEEVWSKK